MKSFGIAVLGVVVGILFWACKVRVAESDAKATGGTEWKCDTFAGSNVSNFATTLRDNGCSGHAFMVDKGSFCCVAK